MERRSAGGSHAAARTVVVWEVLRREVERAAADRPVLRVVDVGGGTGGFAVPLAQAGHDITVVDPSPDALAALTRRAAEAGVAERIPAVQGDADSLDTWSPPGEADLVLCHSVLEFVDSPVRVAAAIAATLRPGGAASVIVANRVAAVLARAIGGHLDAAAAVLRDPDGRAGPRDTLRRRFDAESAAAVLAKAGLTVEQIHGVRVVTDLVPGSVLERDHDALAAFELAVAGLSPVPRHRHPAAPAGPPVTFAAPGRAAVHPRYGDASLADVMPGRARHARCAGRGRPARPGDRRAGRRPGRSWCCWSTGSGTTCCRWRRRTRPDSPSSPGADRAGHHHRVPVHHPDQPDQPGHRGRTGRARPGRLLPQHPRYGPGAQPHRVGSTTRTRCVAAAADPVPDRRRGRGRRARGPAAGVPRVRPVGLRVRRRHVPAARPIVDALASEILRPGRRSDRADGGLRVRQRRRRGRAPDAASTLHSGRTRWPGSTGWSPSWSPDCRRAPRWSSPPTTARSTSPPEHRFDLDTDPRLRDGVRIVAGEARVRYLHTVPGATGRRAGHLARRPRRRGLGGDPGGGGRGRLVRSGGRGAPAADRGRGGRLPRGLRGAGERDRVADGRRSWSPSTDRPPSPR